MLKFLEKAKNFYSWINFGNFVLLITAKTICEILLVVGGISYMPWYSNIGLVIAGIGALGFVYDFYQSYKKRTIPINKAVDIVEAHLKNNAATHTSLDTIFWNRNSGYSTETKNIMLLIFAACRDKKLSLLGKEGFRSEREISYLDVNPDKIKFSKDGCPEIYDYSHNLMFTDLSLEKIRFFKWLKDLSKYEEKHGAA